MAATEAQEAQLYDRLPTGNAGPRTHMPKLARIQFPEIKVNDAISTRPALHSAGPTLIPLKDAANFFAKLQYGAADIQPSFLPHPDPEHVADPEHVEELIPRVCAGGDCQQTCRTRQARRPLGYMAAVRMGGILGGILAGQIRGFWLPMGEPGRRCGSGRNC